MSTTESRVPRSRPKPAGTERVIPSRILTTLCKKPEYIHLKTTLETLPELVTIVFTHGDLGAGKRIVQVKNTAIAVDLTDFNKVLSGCKYFLVKDDDPKSFAVEADIADATITERELNRGATIASVYTLEKDGSTYTLKAKHCVRYAAKRRMADDAVSIHEPTSASMAIIPAETVRGEPIRKRRQQPTLKLSRQQKPSSPAERTLYSRTGREMSPAPAPSAPPHILLSPLDFGAAAAHSPTKSLPPFSSVLSFICGKPGRPDLPFSSTVPPITPTLTTPTITVTPVTTPIPESLRQVLNP